MIDYNELKEEVDKQLEKCDPFFQEYKHRLFIFMYIIYVCEKRLGKKEYKFTIVPNEKGIIVDIETSEKNLKNFLITERKIKRFAKEFSLPE